MPERNYLGYDPKSMGLGAATQSATPLYGNATGQPMTQSSAATQPNYGLSSIQGNSTPAQPAPQGYAPTSPAPSTPSTPSYGLTSAVTPPPSATPAPAPAATATATEPTTTTTSTTTQAAPEKVTTYSDADIAAAKARGMSVDAYLQWKAQMAQPYTNPNVETALKPYQDQIAMLTQKSSAEAQEAERRAMGKARAMGGDLDIAQGLGQFAATEAMGKGAEAIGQVGAQEATALATAEKTDKTERVSALKEQLYNEMATPEGREIIIDQIRQIDPNDPVVQLYDKNPESFKTQFSAQDLKAMDTRLKLATADMQMKITEPLNQTQVKNYWNSGSYKQIMFPSDTKLTADVADWSPSDSEIKEYEDFTGKTYDPNDLDSKKDLYVFGHFKNDFDTQAEQEIQSTIVTQLTENGININDSAMLENIRDYSKIISKSIGTSPITLVDASGQKHEITWDTDFKEGALSPLYYKWDGTAYADGEQPDIADSNMDSLFYAVNDSLKASGQTPMTMSEFREAVLAGEIDATGLVFTKGKMSLTDIKLLSGKILKSRDAAMMEKYKDIKVGTPEEVYDIKTPEQLSEVTPTQWEQIRQDPKAVIALEKIGVKMQENTLDKLGANATSADLNRVGIKPGNYVATNDGKLVKVTRLESWKDVESWGKDDFGWILYGTDENGNEVKIASNVESEADERDVTRNAYDDGSGNWTDQKPSQYGIGSWLNDTFIPW